MIKSASRLITVSLFLSLATVLAASEPKTLTRDIEEVIVPGDELSLFLGQPTDRIHLYRWSTSTASFEAIPFQIDRKKLEQLSQNCVAEPDVDNCEINFAFDANGNPEPGNLGADDEVVFLARDTGPRAPSTVVWKSGNVSNTRYELRVNDVDLVSGEPVIQGSGWAYAFLFNEPHAFELSDPFYVDWIPAQSADPDRSGQTCTTGDPNTTRGPKSCGWFEAIPSAIPGASTYQMRYLGHWIINRLRLAPPGTVGDGVDVIDRMKWRAYGQNGQTEEFWSAIGCARFLGLKRGPVRTIFYAQGSASGPNTTRTDRLYATHWRSTVKLRVHANVHGIFHYLDLLEPSGTTEVDVESGSPTSPEDVVEGIPPTIAFGQWEDWTRVTFPGASLVSFFKETRPFNSGPVEYHYEDAGSGTTHTPEFETGAYGNFGEHFAGPTTDFQDQLCDPLNPDHPSLLFRQLDFTFFSSDPDDANEASTFAGWMEAPLRYESEDQTRTYPIPNPPDPICTPVWSGQINPENGRYFDLSADLSGCNSNATSTWILYRALGAGAFRFHARLEPGQTFRDWEVHRGQTYRYRAHVANSEGKEGPGSAVLSFTADDNDPPPVPTNLSTSSWNQAISIDWDDAVAWDVRGYNLYLSTTSGGPYDKVNNDPIVPTTFTATGLSNGTPYYGVVRTVDWGGNESGDSVEISAVPGP